MKGVAILSLFIVFILSISFVSADDGDNLFKSILEFLFPIGEVVQLAPGMDCVDVDGDGYVIENDIDGCDTFNIVPFNGYSDCNDNDDLKWEILDAYADGDGDLYGNSSVVGICTSPLIFATDIITNGLSSTSNDCNDANAEINPGIIEDSSTCGNGIDEGCNGFDVSCCVSLEPYPVLDPVTCDDGNLCTQDYCFLDSCFYSLELDGMQCGGGICQLGICTLSPCEDSDGDGYDDCYLWETNDDGNEIDCNLDNNTLFQLLNGYLDSDSDLYYSDISEEVCSGVGLSGEYSSIAGGDCNDVNDFYDLVSGNSCVNQESIILSAYLDYLMQDFAIIEDNNSNLHIIYIRFPLGTSWQADPTNSMDLGHESSSDLITWDNHDPALNISETGNWDDEHIWAPSIVYNPVDELYYMHYTGVTDGFTQNAANHKERIGLATSSDLITWDKYPGNNCAGTTGEGCLMDCDFPWNAWGEIEDSWTYQCRDPNVFFDSASGDWYMVYSTSPSPFDWKMIVGLAKSSDLINWEDLGPIDVTFESKAESAHIVKENGLYYLFWTTKIESLDGIKYSFTNDLESEVWSVPENVIGAENMIASEFYIFNNQSLFAGIIGQYDVGFRTLNFNLNNSVSIGAIVQGDCSYVGSDVINPGVSDSNCNLMDEDCSTVADDGYVSDTFCFLPGECAAGNVASSCSVGVVSNCSTGSPSVEICSGLDEDCDGTPDNGLTASLNALQDGVCVGSTQVCGGALGWLDDYSSVSGYEATELTCDGLDNDCDSLNDNGLTASLNALQDGVCVGSTQVCGGALGWLDDYSSVSGYEATELTCDDILNNDCDLSTDCSDSDCSGDAACIVVTPTEDLFILNLTTGWNYVSIPLTDLNEDGISMFNSEIVLSYLGEWNVNYKDIVSQIGIIEPLKGYIVYSNGNQSILFNGTLNETYSYSLGVDNWNLVGASLEGYDFDSGQIFDESSSILPADVFLGDAYWVYTGSEPQLAPPSIGFWAALLNLLGF